MKHDEININCKGLTASDSHSYFYSFILCRFVRRTRDLWIPTEHKNNHHHSHVSLNRNNAPSLLKLTTVENDSQPLTTHFRDGPVSNNVHCLYGSWFPSTENKTELVITVADINCMYDRRTTFKAHIYMVAAELESNKAREGMRLWIYSTWILRVHNCVHAEHAMQLSSMFDRTSMRSPGLTRSRWIPFDCFVVVPVFPLHTATSHLRVLPHPVKPL